MRKPLAILPAIFAALVISNAKPGYSQDQVCIAHHPLYIQGVFEVSYEPGCSGHDEPEIFPFTNAPGSGRDLTWTAILPEDSRELVSGVGPAFWFGGVVSDPKSLFGQSFVELQFYPDAIVKHCFNDGAFSIQFAPNIFTACSPVFRVKPAGQSGKFKEPVAFNAMLVDSASPKAPLIMYAGDTITVHWFTTAAQDGYHVSVTDETTGHSGTIVLNSPSTGPLLPAFDTQAIGNALGWGLVNDAPNSFVWEIGHVSDFAANAGAVCNPGQTVCDSYNAASWSGLTPIRLVSVTFGDGSSPQGWGAVSDVGGKAEVNASCTSYGGPFCIYPWYTLSSAGGFHFGIDYPDTQKDYGQADQFAQTRQCGGPFGANSTYCSTILK